MQEIKASEYMKEVERNRMLHEEGVDSSSRLTAKVAPSIRPVQTRVGETLKRTGPLRLIKGLKNLV
jgi:hypothetical protein